MKHIIVYHFTLVLGDVWLDTIIDTKKIVAECWNHEELLKHAVHVANAT